MIDFEVIQRHFLREVVAGDIYIPFETDHAVVQLLAFFFRFGYELVFFVGFVNGVHGQAERYQRIPSGVLGQLPKLFEKLAHFAKDELFLIVHLVVIRLQGNHIAFFVFIDMYGFASHLFIPPAHQFV